jgi:pSer/pThr/pTyr-binding forkhead associated (FHA) protein
MTDPDPREEQELLAAERLGEPFLLFRNARNRQVLVRLSGDRLTIGRDADMDVVITWDQDVSRIHAELQRAGSMWLLVDDGLSRKGTWVGDARVESRRPLHDGDRIRLGSTTITYRAPSEARASETRVGEIRPL